MNITINITALLAIVSSFTILAIAHVLTERPDVLDVLRRVEGDPDLEAYLREAIENFREQMTLGIPAINMPVLDPLKLENLDINLNEDIATLNLQIQEIFILDLSKFVLHDLHPDLDKLSLTMDLTLPAIGAYGKYKLDGKLLQIFPLYGEGNFEINGTRAIISGSGKLKYTTDTLQITDLRLGLVWEELSVELENFLGGGRFTNVLQKVLPKIGKQVFMEFKPEIMSKVSKALKDELNEQLTKPEVKEIIEGILPDASN